MDRVLKRLRLHHRLILRLLVQLELHLLENPLEVQIRLRRLRLVLYNLRAMLMIQLRRLHL